MMRMRDISPLCYQSLSQLISIWQLIKFKPISMRLANTAGVHLIESVSRMMRVESEMNLFNVSF